jgi:hypothetical protein
MFYDCLAMCLISICEAIDPLEATLVQSLFFLHNTHVRRSGGLGRTLAPAILKIRILHEIEAIFVSAACVCSIGYCTVESVKSCIFVGVGTWLR